jgi:FkbM family methyltransferase
MNSIEQYLNKITKYGNDDYPLLENVISKIDPNTATVLFGASEGGKEIFEAINNKGLSVDYFCDNNQEKWNTDFLNTPVISPKDLQLLGQPDILISSSFQTEIYSQLAKMGLNNVFHFPLIDIISEKHYDFNFHLNHKADILLTANLFEDKKSKTVYKNLIKYRLERDLRYIKIIRTDDMYIPPIIIKNLHPKSTIIDIGAYNGDSVEMFLNSFRDIDQIIAFEPELNNFKNLNKKFKNDKRVIPQNQIISNKVQSYYISNDGAESKVHFKKSDNSIPIQSTTVDTYCNKNNIIPNYIKMDVEGFEIQVIKGALRIIKEHKPLLAVSIYHIASDLWVLPQFILSLNNNYKFNLRHHSFNICDSVLYCY